jgi:two-component SAPR family response regulator
MQIFTEELDGVLVSYAAVNIFERDRAERTYAKILYIEHFAVGEEFRRQDSGTRLFQFLKDYAKENGCDVLISEIELGGTNGIMLAKKMKNLNPKVNIIFLTVCDEKEHAKEVFEIRPSGYLVKPANNEQLAIELNNLRYAACAVG